MHGSWPRHGRLLSAVLIAWLAAGASASGATLETLEPRPGVTERFILMPAQGTPTASVILLVGGEGHLGLRPDNIDNTFGNFVARTRALYVAHGFQVALLDTPSDHGSLGDWRMSADHATDIAAVIRFLHAHANVPVWLVGTSRGTVSAANAATRLATAPADARPDGIVLTSSVTVPNRNDMAVVESSDLAAVRVPVLIVHHKDDHCAVSPFSNAEQLVHAFPNSPKVELLVFEGGDPPRSDACQPFAQHGYLGIEGKVVDAIAAWIKVQSPK